MITASDLANYVGANIDNDEEALQEAIDAAVPMVDLAFASAWREVEEEIVDLCYKRAAASIFRSGKAGGNDNGLYQLAADGAPVPGVANDPLSKCWVVIKRYTSRV